MILSLSNLVKSFENYITCPSFFKEKLTHQDLSHLITSTTDTTKENTSCMHNSITPNDSLVEVVLLLIWALLKA